MTIDPQVLRSERHVEIGRMIQRDSTLLVERWARRAIAEQPNATRLHHPALLDHLPTFLHTLGQSLADSTDPRKGPELAPAAEHGGQRWETGWSLPEVVRDYQILRLVLFDYLEEEMERPLLFHEIQAIGLALDEAIAASISTYVRQRDEHVRRIEQERARSSAAEQQTRQRWERIFQNAGWGIALVRPDDTLEAVNPAFAALHGHDADELVGQPLTEMVVSEERAELRRHLAGADLQGHHGYESVHQRRDGSRFPVRAELVSFTAPSGAVLYRALNVQDVTEARQREQSLREQATALRESDRRKNEFLAVLAHELRNPLAPILNSVEVLRLLGPASPAVVQARDIVERQVKQIVRLVDDLLDLTRVAQGKVELRRTVFDLSTAVAQAIQTTTPLFEAQQHQLVVVLPDEPLRLEADQARVVQVIVNLLNNAAKYTERGGRISLTGSRDGDEVVIRVRDNGVGIEPEMLDRVFDLFTQVGRSIHRAQGGLGIGLTLVRQLVELHGGRVTVHSAGPGQGSEFVVRLPLLPPLATEVPARAHA